MIAEWGAPEALTSQASNLEAVWKIFLVAGAVVALLVYGLIAFAVIRYRRRDDLLPKQVHYRMGIEIAYTILPVVIIIGLLIPTMSGIASTTETVEDPDVVVDVVGSQWRWDFTYRDTEIVGTGELSNVPELVLPVDSTVRFNLTSGDVIHSFWVPEFFYKRDLIPGETQTFDVDLGSRTGTFQGKCAEFCGLEHYSMQFTLRIVSEEEFSSWVAEQ